MSNYYQNGELPPRVEDEIEIALREIKRGKQNEIEILNDHLEKLDREMAASDKHIREQIRAMTMRAELRRQDIISGLEDLRSTLVRNQIPPPVPSEAEMARRLAPQRQDSLQDVASDSYDWAH